MLKFYSLATLLKYNKEKKIIKLFNTSKIYEANKLIPPKFDHCYQKYWVLEDLIKIKEIQNYKDLDTELKTVEIQKLLKTTRTTLYTKMSYNLKLKELVNSNENYKLLAEIKLEFKKNKKQVL